MSIIIILSIIAVIIIILIIGKINLSLQFKKEVTELFSRSKNISNKIREYNDFVKQVDILNLNPDVIFSDITDKRHLLKNIMHYRGLKGEEKIENCPDEQIGKAFQNVYNSACKALNIN